MIYEDEDGVPLVVQQIMFNPEDGYVTIEYFDGIKHRQPIEMIVWDFDGRGPDEFDIETIKHLAEYWWFGRPSVVKRGP